MRQPEGQSLALRMAEQKDRRQYGEVAAPALSFLPLDFLSQEKIHLLPCLRLVLMFSVVGS